MAVRLLFVIPKTNFLLKRA